MSAPASTPDAVLHLATLHLLSQAGFASTSRAASLTLTSVVGQYFKLVARSSIDRANLAGRSKPGALDVIESLHDLGHGFGLDELYEYGLDHGGEVIEGKVLDRLSNYLEEGLAITEPIAELKLVPSDELEEEVEAEEEYESIPRGSGLKDEPMEIDAKGEVDVKPVSFATRLRLPENDYSWLPPLPTAADLRATQSSAPSAAIGQAVGSADEAVTASSSIADRYKLRIPFASSSLTQHTAYNTPPPPSTRRTQNAAPTSLPNLIQTYADTRGEMSVAIRPNGYRLQALDLLRRQIASPDGFATSESLTLPHAISGPQVTPVPVPAHPVVIDPDQQGILSQLVHSIHSANLPPELRERLTSLRPPLAQKRDGVPIHYGPGIRGADEAALLRAKGKEPDLKDESHSQATWDSGPRGLEKFSRGYLPKGKKVLKYVEGDEFPRQEKRKSIDAGTSAGSGGRTTLRLKLGEHASTSPGPGPTADAQIPLVTPGGTTAPTTIKLRLPGSKTPSASPAPSPSAPRPSSLPSVDPPERDVPILKTEPESDIVNRASSDGTGDPPPVTERDFAHAPTVLGPVVANGDPSPAVQEEADRKPSPAALQAASMPASLPDSQDPPVPEFTGRAVPTDQPPT